MMKPRDATMSMEEGSSLLQVPQQNDQQQYSPRYKKHSAVANDPSNSDPDKHLCSNGSRPYLRNHSTSSIGTEPPRGEDNQEFLKRFSLDHTRVLQSKADKERKQSVAQKVVTLAERIQQRNTRTWSEIFAFDPDGNFIFYWLMFFSPAILFNLWTCIAREGFPDIQIGYETHWIVADAIADVAYVVDILVQFRTGFLERGLVELDSKKMARHYVFSRYFIIDLVTLIPLDLIQFRIGIHPILRFPRFLKAYRFFQFARKVEARMVYPNVWRIIQLSHSWYLGLHWFATFYFMLSTAEGYKTVWGYPPPIGNASDFIDLSSLTQKYLRSLYWAVLTLTTIGDLNAPESNWEHVFTIGTYITGVYVVAAIIGSVSNVIESRNATRQEYERLLDSAKAYMRNNKVPKEMQHHVQLWYDYAWKRGKMQGGTDISALGLLPDKLKTELALHVNLETLKQVTIFHECRPEFLQDLVLKMKTLVFTPSDLICKKGEVAREMYIIVDGVLEVISEEDVILRTMQAGDFFGEIGILNLDGGVNKRTADVRSVGYSELIVLSRDDVLSALKDHPDAEMIIREYGERRLRELGGLKKTSMSMITPVCTVNIKAAAAAKAASHQSETSVEVNGGHDRPRSLDSSTLKANWLSSWPEMLEEGSEGEFDLDVIGITRTINGVIRTAVTKRKTDFERRISELEENARQKDQEIERLKALIESMRTNDSEED